MSYKDMYHVESCGIEDLKFILKRFIKKCCVIFYVEIYLITGKPFLKATSI